MAALALAVLLTVAQVEEIEAIAAQVGVDATELQGAVNTTGLQPVVYLRMTGELPNPGPSYGIWDRLAQCEASGIWNNASNPRYKGGLQMDATFWRNYGGLAYAPAPHLASREQQITVAERGLKVQGWGAWPACSRRLGLK